MRRFLDPGVEARYRREIADARSGLRPYVSRKAAAWYLGFHECTLTDLRRRGLGPPTVIHDPSRRQNTHQFYTLADLDAWVTARKGDTYGQHVRLASIDYLSREQKAMELQAQIKRMKAKLHRLKRRIGQDETGAEDDPELGGHEA